MNQTLWMEGRIAGLVEQVAALTKERDAWKQTCAHIGDELATHKTDAQRHLVEQLKSSSAWYEDALDARLKEERETIANHPLLFLSERQREFIREMK